MFEQLTARVLLNLFTRTVPSVPMERHTTCALPAYCLHTARIMPLTADLMLSYCPHTAAYYPLNALVLPAYCPRAAPQPTTYCPNATCILPTYSSSLVLSACEIHISFLDETGYGSYIFSRFGDDTFFWVPSPTHRHSWPLSSNIDSLTLALKCKFRHIDSDTVRHFLALLKIKQFSRTKI